MGGLWCDKTLKKMMSLHFQQAYFNSNSWKMFVTLRGIHVSREDCLLHPCTTNYRLNTQIAVKYSLFIAYIPNRLFHSVSVTLRRCPISYLKTETAGTEIRPGRTSATTIPLNLSFGLQHHWRRDMRASKNLLRSSVFKTTTEKRGTKMHQSVI